jgi:AmmeMemoRadiSam system protein A
MSNLSTGARYDGGVELTAGQQRFLLNTARLAIRAALRGERVAVPQVTDPVLLGVAGCFVSLHEKGSHRLRGCVGRLQASAPLIESVVETAANVLGDPRFTNHPVTGQDLPRLEIDISVLSPLRPAAHPLDFDPCSEGIYLTCAGRSGTFLPQVARQTGWTREQLLTRLCVEKLGLAAEAWRGAEVRLQKYTVVVVGPEGFEEMTDVQ